jgi:hypothetical protein
MPGSEEANGFSSLCQDSLQNTRRAKTDTSLSWMGTCAHAERATAAEIEAHGKRILESVLQRWRLASFVGAFEAPT